MLFTTRPTDIHDGSVFYSCRTCTNPVFDLFICVVKLDDWKPRVLLCAPFLEWYNYYMTPLLHDSGNDEHSKTLGFQSSSYSVLRLSKWEMTKEQTPLLCKAERARRIGGCDDMKLDGSAFDERQLWSCHSVSKVPQVWSINFSGRLLRAAVRWRLLRLPRSPVLLLQRRWFTVPLSNHYTSWLLSEAGCVPTLCQMKRSCGINCFFFFSKFKRVYGFSWYFRQG